MGVYIIAIDRVGLVADTLSERALGCNSLWSAAARLEQIRFKSNQIQIRFRIPLAVDWIRPR